MQHDTAFHALYDALPIAGVDGTIADRMRGTVAAGNVHAKTGFVDRARSLSGYVTTADGVGLIFSFLCNNWTVPVHDVEQVQDAIAVRLASNVAQPPLSVLSVSEAATSILSDIRPCAAERVSLLDSLGRVLATSIAAPLTLPPWDNAAMDGYAVRAEDVATASPESPVMLEVLETIAAGQFPTISVARGTATQIMTGAPMPQGADTVIRVEDTDGGVERVAIADARDARRNVRPRGEDFREGDALFSPGEVIGPAQIGILASIGASVVDVYRRPRVAIVGSGDELVDLDHFSEVATGRRSVSSNNYSIHAAVRAAGAEPAQSRGRARHAGGTAGTPEP